METATHSPQFNEIWAILQETAQRQLRFEISMAEQLEKRRAEDEKRRAEDEKRRAEDEKRRVDEEKRRAEDEKRRVEDEKRQAEAEEKRRIDEEKRRIEAEKRQKIADKETKALRELIGGLGNKFGSFTEGMAFPSMEKVLRKRFGMTTVTTRYKTQRDGETIEIDVLGLANGEINTVVVVEVKSHFKERDIEQMIRLMQRFTEFFPEHKGKKLFGIMGFVDGSEETRQMALKAGLYVAHIHDEIFDLDTKTSFTPRDFSQPA
jgi:hypothetical protein